MSPEVPSDDVRISQSDDPIYQPKTAKKSSPKRKQTDAKKSVEKAKTLARADRSMADVPAETRRRELVKLLKKLGATSPTTARPVQYLAEKIGYTRYDVYCLVYHKYQLGVTGIVKTVQLEGVRGLSAYLTAKGAKIDLDEIG